MNMISQMTDKVGPDRRDYLNMLNGYLLSQMAGYIKKLHGDSNAASPHWSYFYNYFKLLGCCIDRDKNRNNAYLLTTLIEHRVLENCKVVYERHKNLKPLQLHYIQLLGGLLYVGEETLMQQVVELQLLDAVWLTYKANLKRKNALYSASLRILQHLCEDRGLLMYADYLGGRFRDEIVKGHYETQSVVSEIMQRHRAQEKTRKIERGEVLEAQEADQVLGDFSCSSAEAADGKMDEEEVGPTGTVTRSPRSVRLQEGPDSDATSARTELRTKTLSNDGWGPSLGKRLPPAPLQEPTVPSYLVGQSRWGDNQPRVPKGD